VSLRDAGKNLVSVATSGAVVEWDVATLQQKRALPTTLRHVSSASFTPNEPWVVLSGTMDSVGVRDGKVELVDLSKGEALRFKANTNMPTAVLLPEISVGLILQTGWVRRIRYLDQSG
jgi:WD40 repeat protein